MSRFRENRWGRAVRVLVGCGLGMSSIACSGGNASSSGSASSSAAKQSEHAGQHALIGKPAPEFSVPRWIGGAKSSERLSASDFRGKVVVVDFWATWCVPCRESFPIYESLLKTRGEDVVFLGVSVDEDPEGIQGFVESTKVSFRVGWDEEQRASAIYAPPTMPTSYIIDREGIVRYVHDGFRSGDRAEIESVIDSLL